MRNLQKIKIGDYQYPLSFSLFAAQKMIDKYGSMEKIKTIMQQEGNNTEKITVTCELAECLIFNGCEYFNEFGFSMYEGAPVDENGKLVPITARQILLCCGISQIKPLVNKVMHVLNSDQEKKITTKSKNAKKKKQHY